MEREGEREKGNMYTHTRTYQTPPNELILCARSSLNGGSTFRRSLALSLSSFSLPSLG